jgi:ribosomal protein L7/L12
MENATRQLSGAAIAALERGSKIDAIKSVREERGIGLKDAKDVVEEFLAGNPEVQGRLNAASLEGAKGSLRWLLLVAAIATAVILWFGRTH